MIACIGNTCYKELILPFLEASENEEITMISFCKSFGIKIFLKIISL